MKKNVSLIEIKKTLFEFVEAFLINQNIELIIKIAVDKCADNL